MTENIKRKQAQIDLFLNEIAADQAVLRITLQCFLLRLSHQRPEMLQDMKTEVLATIGQTLPSPDPSEQQGAERRKQLTLIRAEQLFLEIEEALGRGESPSGRQGAN